MDVFDFLDVEAVKNEQILTAIFFPIIPKHAAVTAQDGGYEFNYNVVDDNNATYSNIIQNLQGETVEHIIHTNMDLPFKINSYVITQDGLLWQITAIKKRIETPQNKYALRIIKETAQTEYYLRLLQVQNPWGLE